MASLAICTPASVVSLSSISPRAAAAAPSPTLPSLALATGRASHLRRLSSSCFGSRSGLTATMACAAKSFTTGPTSPTVATIAVGDSLPDAQLSYFDKEGNAQAVTVSELTKGKTVVLFAVPGAFTPTCSNKHLPGFIAKAEELRDAGVDTLACVSVNDAFVLQAWGKSAGAADKVLLLSDGLGKFTRALGAQVDLSDKIEGLGVRSRRYSMLVEDGVVKVLNLEQGGAFTSSGAEEILSSLQKASS